MNGKICPDCSTINSSNALRCQNCGSKLDGTGSKGRAGPGQYKRVIIIGLAMIVVSSSIIAVAVLYNKRLNNGVSTSTPVASPTKAVVIPSLPPGLGEVPVASDQYIGVNDGSYPPFDIGGATLSLKEQAAQQLQAGNSQAATALWNTALSQQSNDGETLIYLEDQRILNSGKPYVTLVAATSFTPPFPDIQYERGLQGIYVAQHEFNQSDFPVKLKILVANVAGTISETNSALVAQQIVRIAAKDSHIVGVIGWMNSSNTLNAMKTFTDAKLPVISPQASSDYLTGVSPYFFRVVSPNKTQARAAAQFMKSTLRVKSPVVFVDHKEAYGQNLAQDFESQFGSDGQLHEETFKTDSTTDFAPLIKDALKYHPDAFYFTSASSVDTGHFQDALPTRGPGETIPVIGGDGGYVSHPHAYGRWYFTEYAFHDESQSAIGKRFLQTYKDDFDPGPHPQKHGGYYGYSIPDDHAMLAYDATSVALQALKTAYTNGKTTLTPDALKNELSNIKGANAFQGVSGQIAFGPDNDPVNKAVVILGLAKDGPFKLQAVVGCYLKGCQ